MTAFNIYIESDRHPDTVEAFEEASDVVAEELGEDVARWEVVRELSEAYLGRDALGKWREERQEVTP